MTRGEHIPSWQAGEGAGGQRRAQQQHTHTRATNEAGGRAGRQAGRWEHLGVHSA